MDNHYFVRTVACCTALVLSQFVHIGTAQADSAVGQNTTMGNASHVSPINPVVAQSDGLPDPDSRVPTGRTPTGQMYNIPTTPPDIAEGNATTFHATVEAGVVGSSGDKDAALQKTYKDTGNKNGVSVESSFSVQAEAPADATYMEITGGGVANDDQFYSLQFGKYNDWKIKGFYNEIPHVFTTTAKPIWDGIGTGRLTLKSGISAGAGVTWIGNNTAAAAAGAAVNGTTILCANPVGGAALAVGAPCYVSTIYGSPAGTPTYTPGGAGTTVNPIFVGTPFSANALGAAATTGVNGGINSLATRAIIAAQAAMGYSTIELIRKSGGISLDKNLTDSLKLFTTYTQEKREGARPFGMVQGGGGGANNVEFAEPIDYTTHDFKVGLRYADDLTQYNLTAAVNVFRNGIKSVTVDVPFMVGATQNTALIDQGRFALSPNNEAYNLKGEFSRALPDFYKGNFTAVANWNSARQNDDLLPPTITSGVGLNAGAAGGFNGNYNEWNTTAALSEKTSNARIDNTLATFKLTLHPVDSLTVAGNFRYQNQDVKTQYLACNPGATYGNGIQYTGTVNGKSCTGVWGRLINDGGAVVFLNPGTQTSGNLINGVNGAAMPSFTGIGPMASNPWGSTTKEYAFTADYRLNGTSTVNLGLAREDVNRQNMEVNTTTEEKVKVGYVNRDFRDGSLRVSYERDHKRGTNYNVISPFLYVYSGFFDPATVPAGTNLTATFVPRLADIHKLFMADRDQNILNARLNHALREDLDLGINATWKGSNFPGNSMGGQEDLNVGTLGFDLNYQPSEKTSFYSYYTYQESLLKQNNVNNTAPAAVGSGLPGAASYACTNGTSTPWGIITPYTAAYICGTVDHNITYSPFQAYDVTTKDTNNVIGFGFKLAMAKQKLLELNYTRSESRTKISYNYVNPVTSPGNLSAVALANAAVAGYGMPDNTFVSNVVSANLLVPLNKQASLRFLGSYENGSTLDWHYPANMTSLLVYQTGATAQMDAGPQSYHIWTGGILFQYKM